MDHVNLNSCLLVSGWKLHRGAFIVSSRRQACSNALNDEFWLAINALQCANFGACCSVTLCIYWNGPQQWCLWCSWFPNKTRKGINNKPFRVPVLHVLRQIPIEFLIIITTFLKWFPTGLYCQGIWSQFRKYMQFITHATIIFSR